MRGIFFIVYRDIKKYREYENYIKKNEKKIEKCNINKNNDKNIDDDLLKKILEIFPII